MLNLIVLDFRNNYFLDTYYVLGIMLGTGEYGSENKWNVTPSILRWY